MTGPEVAGVLALGTLAALDLVSWPQVQLSRPLVSSLLGGLVVGAPLEGLGIGVLLELFAMETLPVGASRYPDWGPGAVAAGALAGAAGQGATGPGPGTLAVVTVAALSAWAGGWLIYVVRRANAAALHGRVEALERGDRRALAALQRGGLLRDGLRGLLLTAFTLLLGGALSGWVAGRWHAPAGLSIAALGAVSAGAALAASWRLYGRRPALAFLSGGLVAGFATAAVWLR